LDKTYYHIQLWDRLASAQDNFERKCELNEARDWNEGYLAATYTDCVLLRCVLG